MTQLALVNLPNALPIEEFCRQQAEVIRALARRTVRDTIEIGQRLTEVHARLDHGEWLPWIEREFGWSKSTAYRLTQIAETFGNKVPTVGSFEIELRALELLSAPAMPEEVREAAIERAADGEAITLEKAEQMIADHVAKHIQPRMDDLRDKNAVLSGDNAKLREQIETLAPDAPTIESAIELFRRVTGKKRLTDRQLQALAAAYGEPLQRGDKVFPPMTEQEIDEGKQAIARQAAFRRMLAYFVEDAPEPQLVKEALRDFALKQAREQIPVAVDWLRKLQRLLN